MYDNCILQIFCNCLSLSAINCWLYFVECRFLSVDILFSLRNLKMKFPFKIAPDASKIENGLTQWIMIDKSIQYG